jgi:tripartite-type tricarboxylate transporter receptor subunit TctC
MKKKLFATLIVVVILLSLVACSGSSGQSSAASSAAPTAPVQSATTSTDSSSTSKTIDWPKKSITILCPWAAGGGSDLAIRTLVPYLESELGTTITVENKTGANGWIAWTELYKANPDGYTIAQMNVPTFSVGYLDRVNKREHISLDDFIPLCNQISDWGCLVVKHGDTRFSNVKEFIAYAQANEMLAGDSGMGSQKHMVAEMLNDQLKTKFTPVHQAGWSETYAAILGGHIDVGWGSIGECLQGYTDGEVDVLAIFASKRSSLLPDVPTFAESGFPEILSPSDRGYVAPAGIDEKILEIYDKAFEKAIRNSEFITAMEKLGQSVNYIDRIEFTKYCQNNEKTLKDYAELMGWDMG